MLQRFWQDFSLPKFHGFAWQPPTCWKKTPKAGVAAASVASEKMKEKAAATGTQKLGFVFWGWCFLPFFLPNVKVTIKAACVYVCSLGFVVCFFYWFYPMVNHHHEANHHLKGEYVWFTFSKDLKSKPKGSKNCLIFFLPLQTFTQKKKSPGLVGDIFCRRLIWVGYVGSLGFVESWLSILCHGKTPWKTTNLG